MLGPFSSLTPIPSPLGKEPSPRNADSLSPDTRSSHQSLITACPARKTGKLGQAHGLPHLFCMSPHWTNLLVLRGQSWAGSLGPVGSFWDGALRDQAQQVLPPRETPSLSDPQPSNPPHTLSPARQTTTHISCSLPTSRPFLSDTPSFCSHVWSCKLWNSWTLGSCVWGFIVLVGVLLFWCLCFVFFEIWSQVAQASFELTM